MFINQPVIPAVPTVWAAFEHQMLPLIFSEKGILI